MKKSILGRTGIEVTELCFGALPMGPLQKNLTAEESSEVLAYALENDINFVDTAQVYRTYDPIRLAIKKTGIRPVIASKAHAATYEEMEKAVNEALDCMGVDYIDIFHLHAPRANTDIFEVRKGALQCLLDLKSNGIIKAVGISTHSVKVVEAAAERQDMDIVFPLINRVGRGIQDGTAEDMKKAIASCEQMGKGIYLMKVLGGGTLADDYDSSMKFARSLEGCQSIALGMVSREEVLYNVKYFNDEKNIGDIIKIKHNKNVKVMQGVCISCGKCIETCHSAAVAFADNGKASVDPSKCVQCGYCIASCPAFSIRIV